MNGNARVRLSPPRGSPLPEPVTLCNGSGTALGVTKVVVRGRAQQTTAGFKQSTPDVPGQSFPSEEIPVLR